MKEWKKVFLLTLAGLIFRVSHYFLFKNTFVLGGDQIQNILLAKKFASGNFYGVLDTYWTPLYPILIGIFTYFIDSLIIPSAIISIVAGSLAVTFTYYFVKQSYGKKEALIAALIAIFYPHLMNSVFALGTENIYLLLIVGALFFGWKGLNYNSPKLYFLTGILLGLAYLTRPEAFGYIAFFGLFALVKNLWQGKLFSKSAIVQIIALVLGFSILATPYIVYLRGETGVWTISGKIEVNLAAGSLQEDVEDEDLQVERKQPGMLLIKSFFLSLIYIQKIFDFLLPFLLIIFIALGLFGNKWNIERFKREIYLILFCVFTIVGYALAVSETRYFYILLPIFFGWIARGILYLKRWINRSTHDWMPKKFSLIFDTRYFVAICLIFIYLYVLPLNMFMSSTEKLWKTNAYEERNAGLWLRENGKPSPVIFSASRRPVFYAEGEQVNTATTNKDEILAEMKDPKVDYVILGERTLKRNPFLEGFSENLKNDQNFELIYQQNEQPGYGIRIFKKR
jgi:hypothetical protein